MGQDSRGLAYAWQTLDMSGYAITTTGLGLQAGKRSILAGGAYNLQDYVHVTMRQLGEKGEGICRYAGRARTLLLQAAMENGSFSRGALLPMPGRCVKPSHSSARRRKPLISAMEAKARYQYSGPQDGRRTLWEKA